MDDNYYYCEGKKIPLTKATTQKALVIEKEGPETLKKGKNFSLPGVPEIHNLKKSLDNKLHLFVKKGKEETPEILNPEGTPEKSISVSGEERNVYSTGNSETLILTKEFFLKFKENVSNDIILQFLNSQNLTVVKELGDLLYLVELPDYNEPMKKINRIYENDNVEYASPNFTILLTKQFIPDDEFFNSRQWAINKSMGNTDLNLQEAWDITHGSPDIVIAILDEGVDYSHKDLNVNGKLVEGFDSVKDRNDANPIGNDAHGTHCAGVAAAEGNNGLGICGIAPGCKVLGIRIANSDPNNPNLWDTKVEYIKAGIDFAAGKADVLNNSWAFDSDQEPIKTAIRNAQKNGRSGNGCIVCCCAGNYLVGHSNENVLFPGNMDEVITVAASGKNGLYKDIDINFALTGENTWKSRTGDQVDVCAPGVEIATTDISGDRGTQGSGDYYFAFNGTSASTPQVAGIAALILSIRPNLNFKRVKEILTETAIQMYPGIKNKFVGFGMVNALAALQKTQQEPN